MAKKKVKDLKAELLNDDFELEDTDTLTVAILILARAMGRLAAKPRGNL